MVEWRRRGYVEDSDDEDSISDSGALDVDTRQAATTTDSADYQNEAHSSDLGNIGIEGQIAESSRAVADAPVRSDEDAVKVSLGTEKHDEYEDIDELQANEASHDILSSLPGSAPKDKTHAYHASNVFDIPSSQPNDASDLTSRSDKRLSASPPPTPAPQSFPSRLSAPTPSDNVQEVETVLPRQNLAQEQGTFHGRTFRQRHPIQVHPYQLENETYRQAFRARGLRPVHVANEELRRHVESLNDETHEARNDSEPFMLSSGASEPPVSSSSPPIAQQPSATATNDYEDELPSLDDLLKRRADGTLQRSQKRCKIAHRPEDTPTGLGSGSARVPQRVATSDDVVLEPQTHSLPSPDNSGHHAPRQHASLKKFKHPKSYQATPLLTPGPSSDADKHLIEPTHFNITSDVESTASPMPTLRNDAHSAVTVRSRSLTASEASSEDSGVIRRARKRIKGVLPASWLHIDRQAQRRRPSIHLRRDRSPSPLDIAPHRGVAQRVSSKTKMFKMPHGAFGSVVDISDESDRQTSTKKLAPTPRDSQDPSLTCPSTGQPLDTQDLDEDDWIDPMLTSATRHRSSGNRSMKGQTRLKDAFARSHSDMASYRAKLLLHDQTSSKPSTRPRDRRSQTKLSIVDVVEISSRKSAPDFLRLALRQAEKRKDKGRHSPSAKQISFHEPEDTGYAQNSIRSWKRGRLNSRTAPKSSKSAPAIPRGPLREQSGNRQTCLPSPIKAKARLSNTTSSRAPWHSNAEWTRYHGPPGKKRQTQLQPVYSEKPSADTLALLTSSDQPQNRPVIQKIRTNLKDALFTRPGQLEDLRDADMEDFQPSYAFEETLRNLDDPFDRRKTFQQRTANPMLDRFLSSEPVEPSISRAQSSVMSTLSEEKRKMLRKRRPQQYVASAVRLARLDFEDHFPTEKSLSDSGDAVSHHKRCVVAGLAPYGATYTTDFGIGALPESVFFHQSTFIGSLELQDALYTGQRDLSRLATSTITINASTAWRWSFWNEEVASQLEGLLLSSLVNCETHGTPNSEFIANGLYQGDLVPPNTFRLVVSYFAKSLSFSDEHDRLQCVRRVTAMLRTRLQIQATRKLRHDEVGPLETLTFLAVLAFQNYVIAQDPRICQDIKGESEQVFAESTRALASNLVAAGLPEIRGLLRAADQANNGHLCIRADQQASEGLVVLYHLTGTANIGGLSFWDVINGALNSRTISTFTDLTSLEPSWENVFTVLPHLQIDVQGLNKPTASFYADPALWTCIRVLLSRTFQLYEQAETSQGAMMNSYIRAILTRCLQLMLTWGWGNAESVLGCIYDFFARRGFALLDHEGARGSLRFLERLDQTMDIKTETSDRSFDIFLKVLVLGLNDARDRQPEKKVKNVIWRFIPNHGRRHAKEAELLETDLDKLRNQHNLLCVLYRISPASHRLSTSHLRNLVDVKSSHFEIVRINIRTWANLVRFQLSTEEAPATVESFAEWFKSMLRDLIDLHRQARKEAEASSAIKGTYIAVSRDALESVVANNERQVEGLITMLLASLNALIDTATNRALSRHMFEHCNLWVALSLFDPKKPRLFQHVSLAFDSYQTHFRLCQPENTTVKQVGDDSQDFGDWSDIEALADSGEAIEGVPHHLEQATKEAHKTLSDCFGAENLFDEALLKKATDTWVHGCNTLVTRDKRNWSYFLDTHSTGSWFQLRDTEQSRVYSIYFAARVIVVSPTAYRNHKASLLTTWITSLVERESMLKFQHMLTTALLTVDDQAQLLRNLPFWRKPGSSDYSISLEEIRARRLSLISSILANTRRYFEDTTFDADPTTQILRTELTSLLRAMMSEMKRVYLELQQASSLRGAYVDFVQKIIEYLQQYTADIVPIDKFFTDSGAFPLPATDPMYVVGRLKSYRSSLSDERSQKKLTVFLQTVCERAAADNQQAYLVGQLSSAVEGLWEDAQDSRISLRVLLLEALFPCYMTKALSVDCGWILALPILEAIDSIFAGIAHVFDGLDLQILSSITHLTTAILKPMRALVSLVAIDPMLLHHTYVTRTVRAVYLAATSILPIADYIARLDSPNCDALTSHTRYLYGFAQVLLRLSQSQDARLDISQHPEPDTSLPRTQFTNITAFCDKELTDSLRNNWVKHGNEYFVIRGRERREVVVDLATPEQEQEELIDTVERFVAVWKRMPGMREMI